MRLRVSMLDCLLLLSYLFSSPVRVGAPCESSQNIYVQQNHTLYHFKQGASFNVTCSHTCDPSGSLGQLSPSVTIQLPGEYAQKSLNSPTLREDFRNEHSLRSLDLHTEEECLGVWHGHHWRLFHLELIGVNTTQFNNSVVHCGVLKSGTDYYYANGVSFLLMTDDDNDEQQSTSTDVPTSTTTTSTSTPIPTTTSTAVTTSTTTTSTSTPIPTMTSTAVTTSTTTTSTSTPDIPTTTNTATASPTSDVETAAALKNPKILTGSIIGAAAGGAIAGIVLTLLCCFIAKKVSGSGAKQDSRVEHNHGFQEIDGLCSPDAKGPTNKFILNT